MEHVVVWAKHFGTPPKGSQVHHKNGDKLDNRIQNLELVSPLQHKREHSGCKLVKGVWWKPCPTCQEFKPVSEYYQRPDGLCYQCKVCFRLRASRDAKRRRIRKRASHNKKH